MIFVAENADAVCNKISYFWRVEVSEKQTIQQLLSGEIATYEEVYKTYFKALYVYAYTLLKDELQAEEIVQNLFLKIWDRRDRMQIESSLKAYLYKSVYHDSLNYLKHVKVKATYEQHATHVMKNQRSESSSHRTMYNNLEEKLRAALNELPEQCRTVFQLSRYEELKYREIADRLQISEKTVENHMGKALKLLRVKLAEFIISVVVLFSYLKNICH
ncbi:MAG: RNA polymerase sigma-70 factor [Bacteroidetes bacterium]|nr:RNA polymerase sigma-70 factor [Bacteroidota bacterium]MBP6314334.1 RNA polymerase sigma-70 factor [Chitinophagaceae bacterium]